MVMEIDKDMITYSPLFWDEKIVRFTKLLKVFNSRHEKVGKINSTPIVEARTDHEIMRRWNCIIKSQ